MDLNRTSPEMKQKILMMVERERRYFKYHRRRIQLDNLGNHICSKIHQLFDGEEFYLHQALWMYHSANHVFMKTIELSKYPWKSRERTIHARHLLALKGFLLKDLLQWEKTS